MHRPDERGQIRRGTANADLILDGSAGQGHLGQLPPAAQAVALVSDHAQHAMGPGLCEQVRHIRGHFIHPVSLREQCHCGQRIQQDGRDPWVAFDPGRQLCRIQRLGVEDGEDIQLRRRDHDARRMISPHQLRQLLPCPTSSHVCIPFCR